MTKKAEEETNDKKKTPAKKSAAKEKLILYEAVQEHPKKNYILMGALASAGLLEQYRKEESEYGIEDITPSITMDELNKIVNEFLGE